MSTLCLSERDSTISGCRLSGLYGRHISVAHAREFFLESAAAHTKRRVGEAGEEAESSPPS